MARPGWRPVLSWQCTNPRARRPLVHNESMPTRVTRRQLIAAGPALAAAQTASVRLPRPVRLALVGFDGHTGEILGPLGRLPDVQLVAVADPNAERLHRFGRQRQFREVRLYEDYREMLEAEEVDVAGVCTPNGSRAEAVLACLKHGVHVAAEKPLALNRPDLERIRQTRARHDLRLTMLLPMRFAGPYQALRKVVESGEIGEVCQISSQKSYKIGDRPEWMRNRDSYGGTIPWIGIHMIDLMRWVSGREYTGVFSYKTHIGFPEIGDMENVTGSLFRLDNTGIATLRMDYLRPDTAATHGDARLRLAGTKGVAEYQDATGVTVASISTEPRRLEELPEGRPLFLDFLESVYLDRPHVIELDDVFRVTEVTIAAEESAVEHREVTC